MNKIEVLHFLPSLDKSGISTMLQTFYKYMDHEMINFNFVHSGEEEDFHKDLIRQGSKIFYLPPLTQVGLKTYNKKLKNIFDSFYDLKIVHIHKNYLSGIVASAAKKHGIPVRIIHIRGVVMEGKIRLLKRLLTHLIKRNGTDFFAVSPESGIFYYGNSFPFRIINNAVEIDKFLNPSESRIRQLINEFGDYNYISHIGRISTEKNHQFSLKLIQRVCTIDSSYRLLIVGDGELREDILRQAQALNIDDKVIFTGIRNDIPEILAISKINVLPSFSEGLPNVVVQAQAANTMSLVSSTITKTVDLGLDLVKFLSLEDVDPWVQAIFESREAKSKDEIIKSINHCGFNVEVEARELQEFYMRKYNEN